ncbi:MAG: fibronectin type III domain-containing protein [Proteobacteria bacterium]|nr:fibronectin type III domain-containing protein [Pseudomonadota bacterium]
MIRVRLGGTTARMLATAGLCVLVAACGDDGSAATQAANANVSMPIDRSGVLGGMQIQGSPAKTAKVGQAYSFEPFVPGTNGTTVKFTIANAPSWAKFDSATGKLSGTPTASQVGTYPDISIAAVSGTSTVMLPAFSIVVMEGNSQGNVTLSWQAPTSNADGSALMDLKGYKVHYGPESKSYSDTIQVTNAGITTFVVDNLEAGKYYFAVTAYNAAGQESSLSPEVWTQVD